MPQQFGCKAKCFFPGFIRTIFTKTTLKFGARKNNTGLIKSVVYTEINSPYQKLNGKEDVKKYRKYHRQLLLTKT